MTPGTAWTEGTAPYQGWQRGIVQPGTTQQTIMFGAMLIGDGLFSGITPTVYTEMTVAATSHTEMTVAATTWTEGTL